MFDRLAQTLGSLSVAMDYTTKITGSALVNIFICFVILSFRMEPGQASPLHTKARPLFWFNSDDCNYPWYGCKWGVCIPSEWLCDGIADCLDGEDELCTEGDPRRDATGPGATITIKDNPRLFSPVDAKTEVIFGATDVPKRIHYGASAKEKRELPSPNSQDHAVRSSHAQALGLMREAHALSEVGDLFVLNGSSVEANETKLEGELSIPNSQVPPNASITNETSFMPIIFPQLLTTTQGETTSIDENTTDNLLATAEISTLESITPPVSTVPSFQAATYTVPFPSSSFSSSNNETLPRFLTKSQISLTSEEPSSISSFFSYPVSETTPLTTSNLTPISDSISSTPSTLPYFFTSTHTHSSYIHTDETSGTSSTFDHTSSSTPSNLAAFQEPTLISLTNSSTLSNHISSSSTPLTSLYDHPSYSITSVSPTSNTSSTYLSPTNHSDSSLSVADKVMVRPEDIATYLEILGQKYLIQVEKLSSITEELKTVKEHLVTNLNTEACSCSRSPKYEGEKAKATKISIAKYTCLPHFQLVATMCIYTHIYPPVTWLDAAYICQTRNSRLLTLSSKGTFVTILSQLNRDKMQIYDFWIGATNKNVHHKWQWITGSNITTNDFFIPSLDQEYDDGSKGNQCGFMDRDFQMFINGSSCYEERGFICQAFPLIPKIAPQKVHDHS